VTDENLDENTSAAYAPAEAGPATAPDTGSAAETKTAASSDAPPQYGVGPFSIREVALGGVWLIAFIVSFFPVSLYPGESVLGGANVWVSGLEWVLAIGVPTVAVFLIVLRRLSPQGIPRFGSLGIDQFASVAFSVATIFWLQTVWETVAISLETGLWVRSWVIWVELVLMLAGVVLTVLAPFLPALEQDFQDRAEIPAHRNARPIRPVVARPKRERPVAAPVPAAAPAEGYAPQAYATGAQPTYEAGAQPTYDTGAQPAYDQSAPQTAVYDNATATAETGNYGTDVFAPLNETGPQTVTEEWDPTDETVRTPQAAAAPAQQAFWALVPVERDVVDDYGSPLFRIGPTAWALVIEDRGEAFVVRHEDGRIGYLHDISGVTRG
jgi:hypothetical protein